MVNHIQVLHIQPVPKWLGGGLAQKSSLPGSTIVYFGVREAVLWSLDPTFLKTPCPIF